jgi:hypothetical protein
MKTFTHTFEISDEAYNLLLSIQEKGYAEYRDTNWESLEDFHKDKDKTNWRSEDHFLSRNHGGTYHLTDELVKYNLIDLVEESWHTTYELTNFGKEMLSLQNIRNGKLNELLK